MKSLDRLFLKQTETLEKFVIELKSGQTIAAYSQQAAIQGVTQSGAKWPDDVNLKKEKKS